MERAGFGRSDCDGEWQRPGLLRPGRVVDAQIVSAGSERPRVHDGLRFSQPTALLVEYIRDDSRRSCQRNAQAGAFQRIG